MPLPEMAASIAAPDHVCKPVRPNAEATPVSSTLHDHARWGAPVWGEADQLGAGNLLTTEKRLAALALVREGRVFDISHEIGMNAPFMIPNQTPFLLSMWATWRDTIRRRRKTGVLNDAGVNVERMEMTAHVGTHIDALGHFSIGDRLYNNNAAAETVTDWGLDRLGIEQAPPMITRSVLLDVAAVDGGPHLNPGRVVTPEDLARAADRAATGIEPGDVVMIRTGWGRYFGIDNARYLQGEPGIDVAAARWLTGQGAVAIGCDNMAVEVLPNPDRTLAMPVHQHALVEAGVHLIENLALEELAASGHPVGCIVLLPVKFRGATGCPVRPVVMV
jgi:kynurenine formamidase